MPIKKRTLHLFAGAGGGILADILQGSQPIAAVEIESYPRQVLHARQKDGSLPWFPIFDDVTTFDGKPWRGLVDQIAGGFPCQDISVAGKGAGIDGERSGMWGEMARIIGEIRPKRVLVENSPMLVGRGLTRVLSDLAEMGYDAEWGIIGAHHASAPHKRDRIWIVATDTESTGARDYERGIWRFSDRCGERKEGMGSQVAYTEGGRRGVSGISDSEKRRNGSEEAQSTGSSGNDANSDLKRCDSGCGPEREHEDSETEIRPAKEDIQQWSERVDRSGETCADVPDSMRNGSQGIRQDGATKGSTGLRLREGGDEIENLPCEFCGYEFDIKLGKYGCPLCEWDESELPNARDDGDEQRIGQLREDQQTSGSGASERGGEEVDEIGQWRTIKSRLGRMADELAQRMDKLRTN